MKKSFYTARYKRLQSLRAGCLVGRHYHLHPSSNAYQSVPPQGIIVKIKHGRRKLQPLTVKNLLPAPIHWVDCTNRLSQNCGHMSGIVRFSLALHSVVLCNRCTFTASHLRTCFFLKKLDRNKVDIGGSQYSKLLAHIKMPY